MNTRLAITLLVLFTAGLITYALYSGNLKVQGAAVIITAVNVYLVRRMITSKDE